MKVLYNASSILKQHSITTTGDCLSQPTARYSQIRGSTKVFCVWLIAFCFGCASLQIYEGPARSSDETATLAIPQPQFATISERQVDSKHFGFFESAADLLPGVHTVHFLVKQFPRGCDQLNEPCPELVRGKRCTSTFTVAAGEGFRAEPYLLKNQLRVRIIQSKNRTVVADTECKG